MTNERQASEQPPVRPAHTCRRPARRASVAAAAALAALFLPAAAHAASPLSWSRLTIDAGNALSAITCPSEALCVAVDSSGNVLASSNPTAALPTWTVRRSTGQPLSSVSCASMLCVAAGGHDAFVSSDGAASWSSAVAADPGGTLSSISCPTSSLCVAVDEAGQALATGSPASPNWPAAKIEGSPVLHAVSCPGVSACVAVDGSGHAFGSQSPAAGAWLRRTIGTQPFTAVSCSPSGPCVALDATGDAFASADASSAAATWSSTPIDSIGGPLAVSCAASELCVAVDDHGQAFASDAATAAVPFWGSSNADAGVRLTGISCLAGGICVAVDAAGQLLSGRVLGPEAFASPPAEVTQTAATLSGVVNPHDAVLESCTFEYGQSGSYGQSVPCASLPAPAGGAQVISAQVSGLAANTTYHYRLSASSLAGTGVGPDQAFTTAVSGLVPLVFPHPSIHGTPAVGSRLSCQSGVPSGAARVIYAWLRDLIGIPRANGSSYTVAGTDSGHHLQCEVSASDAGGTASARSAFVTIPIGGVVAAAGETLVGRGRFSRGALRVPIRCSPQATAGCRITLRLSSGTRSRLALGGARVRLSAGQHRIVSVGLNSAAKRLLAHARTLTARLVVSGTVIGVLEATLSQQRVAL